MWALADGIVAKSMAFAEDFKLFFRSSEESRVWYNICELAERYWGNYWYRCIMESEVECWQVRGYEILQDNWKIEVV